MRKRREERLDAELRFHIEEQVRDYVSRGMSEPEARRRVRLEFGGLDPIKEACRDVRVFAWFDRAVRDLQYALRILKRRPAFTATAILSLTLGIGANTALFSILQALLLKALPVERPYELVRVTEAGRTEFSYPAYDRLRRGSRLLSDVIMVAGSGRPLEIQEGTERSYAYLNWVSDNFFDAIGVRPFRGRVLREPELGTPEAVISYGYWQRHYGGSPSVLGGRLRLGKRDYTVAGIAPPGFRGVDASLPADIWISFEQSIALDADERVHGRWLRVMARLRTGATMAQAEAEARASMEAPVSIEFGANGYFPLRATLSRPLFLLEFLAGLLLLVSCANLANLVLAGAASRGRELAVRRALGASRGTIIRQLFMESLVLSAAGGLLAIVVAKWTSAALLSFLPADQAQALVSLEFEPNGSVLGFAGLLSFLTCLLFGAAPTVRATRAQPAAVGGRGWMNRALVVSEVAMCTLLLIVAGVFVRSTENLRNQETGYREEGLLVADVVQPWDYSEERRDQFLEELRARAAALPGVEAASFSNVGQLAGGALEYDVRTGDGSHTVFEQRVSPAFLRTMGTRLLSGRDFDEGDDAGSRQVAIVNEAFVRLLVRDGNPIGKHFLREGSRNGAVPGVELEIVGVAEDAKWIDLRSDSPPMYYRPYRQNGGIPGVRLAVRTTGELSTLAVALRETARAVDRQVRLENVMPFREVVNRTLRNERLVAEVSSAFSLLALLIAAVGLYGVLTYAVARRRREIGVRMALGASAGRVERMVVGESVILLAIGFAHGVWCAGPFRICGCCILDLPV